MEHENARGPALRSRAFEGLGRLDHGDMVVVELPAALAERWALDPAAAARAIFDVDAAPPAVKMLFGLRQIVASLLRIREPEAERRSFDVHEVVAQEALIVTAAPHLTFRCGVAISGRLLCVSTGVRFNDWRGRAYFVPVSVLHAPVLLAMVRRAVRRQPQT